MVQFTGIDKIKVSGYKSIKECELSILPITVLAGSNSTGKSSMMQPLLLLKQTFEAGRKRPLVLKGKNAYVSSLAEAKPRFASDDYLPLSITIANKKVSATSVFSPMENGHSLSDGVVLEKSCFVTEPKFDATDEKREICFCATSLPEYLRSAMNEKYGKIPSDINYRVESEGCFYHIAPISRDGRPIAARGYKPSDEISTDIQGVMHLPALRGNVTGVYRDDTLNTDHPFYEGTFPEHIARIIEKWSQDSQYDEKYRLLVKYLDLLRLAKGVATRRITGSLIEILVGWHHSKSPSKENGTKQSDMVGIADVGVGVSQVLPILTALVAAEENQLVYIDQPDIHLHPFAQRGLADVIVDVAMQRVRVVIETHSALFLLALQTAIAARIKCITPEHVAMYWFNRKDDGSTYVDRANIAFDGTYGSWPVDLASTAYDLQREFSDALAKQWKEWENNQ